MNPFSDGQDEISLINRAQETLKKATQENAFSDNQFCENLQGTFERPPQFHLSAKVIQKQRESLKNIKYADEQEDMEIRVRWRPEIINFRFPRIQGSDFASKASLQPEVTSARSNFLFERKFEFNLKFEKEPRSIRFELGRFTRKSYLDV